MTNLQSTSTDIEEIVEIRECSNNEQFRGNRTSHCDFKSEPQTQQCRPQSQSNVIDMATTKESSHNSSKDNKLKNRHRTPPPPGIKDDLTVIAHLCLAIYVVIICYLCFSNPFTFFTWHPLLLTIGVSFLIPTDSLQIM